MERVSVLCLLLLLCSLSGAELQDSDITGQRKESPVSVDVPEQPQPCPSDLHAVLRDMSAKLALLQSKMETQQTLNQEQAAELKELKNQVDTQQQGIVLEHNKVEYHYINIASTWEEARQYCREHYVDLATLESEEDMYNLKIPSGTPAWIGLFDDPASWRGVMTSDSNSWRWSATGTTSPGGYQNWALNNPDKFNGIELCVNIQNGVWNDFKCNWSLHFMCYTVQPSGTKDYVVITTAKTWPDAQAYCRRHYYDLAMIENAAENEAATSRLSTKTTTVWIGLYRTPWRWSDGTSSTFSKWLSVGPNNNGGSEFCVSQSSDYVWNDAPCNSKYGFVCYEVKPSTIVAKVTIRSSTQMSNSTIRDKFLKELGNRFGVGISLSFIKEKEKPNSGIDGTTTHNTT